MTALASRTPATDALVRTTDLDATALAIASQTADIVSALNHLAALAQQEQTPQSSVQIEQAAKPGAPPRITVKVYAPMPGAAADMAQQLYDSLTARYAVGAEAGA